MKANVKNQPFRLEISMTGISRVDAAEIAASYFSSPIYNAGHRDDTFAVHDQKNRIWYFTPDELVFPERKQNVPAPAEYSCKLVTPICSYEDIDTIGRLGVKLKEAGAFVNPSCGLSVQISGQMHTCKSLVALIYIFYNHENLLYQVLEVENFRAQYCKKFMLDFVEAVKTEKIGTFGQLETVWYQYLDGADCDDVSMQFENNPSKYYGLNLHNFFLDKKAGMIEFRLFNGSLDADIIRAYTLLSLAISAHAASRKCASIKTRKPKRPKIIIIQDILEMHHIKDPVFEFKKWLIKLGLTGKEYETACKVLLSQINRNSDWRYKEVYRGNWPYPPLSAKVKPGDKRIILLKDMIPPGMSCVFY